jgi:hypothetical protein
MLVGLFQKLKTAAGVAAAFYRDNNDQYLRASAVVFHGVTDQATLEALACREALALAEDVALDRGSMISKMAQ